MAVCALLHAQLELDVQREQRRLAVISTPASAESGGRTWRRSR